MTSSRVEKKKGTCGQIWVGNLNLTINSNIWLEPQDLYQLQIQLLHLIMLVNRTKEISWNS